MPEELLTITLILEPLIEHSQTPVNWYGRAAQALLLKALSQANKGFLPSSYHTKIHLRPFTASTLLPAGEDSFRNGLLHPGVRYQLRYSALTAECAGLLERATQPGGILSMGETIPLVHKFYVRGILKNEELPLQTGGYSYASLREKTCRQAGRLADKITLKFTSPTAFSQTGKAHTTGQPTPRLVFQHLADKWNSFSPPREPKINDEFQDFICEFVEISKYELKTVAVKFESAREGDHSTYIGFTGTASFGCRKTNDPHWVLAHLLAAFSTFAGVGKNTARGFGQCHPLH